MKGALGVKCESLEIEGTEPNTVQGLVIACVCAVLCTRDLLRYL